MLKSYPGSPRSGKAARLNRKPEELGKSYKVHVGEVLENGKSLAISK